MSQNAVSSGRRARSCAARPRRIHSRAPARSRCSVDSMARSAYRMRTSSLLDELAGRSEDKTDEPPFMGSKIELDQAIIVQPGQGNERKPAKGNAVDVHR